MTDTNNKSQEADVNALNNNEGEGENNGADEVVSISKNEYDKLNQTLGSLKRELKDLRKPKDDTKETSTTNNKPDENLLLNRIEKMALKAANITHEDDIELARKTAKKWNMDLEDVLTDDDFQVKLAKQQSSRANIIASTNIKGGASQSNAKNTPEYWIAKGVPPTVADVPDRKTRATIARAMMANVKTGKKFYND